MNDAKATLMRIDPARNAIVARIKVHTPEAAAAGDGAVWLSNPSWNTVNRVDPATNRVTAYERAEHRARRSGDKQRGRNRNAPL
jgi:DNA-binding beta-propeller fold protein YncE